MSLLTESQIKYLHVIYETAAGGGLIRSVDISRKLGVTKASVSRMMKLLMELELITVEEHGLIRLTPKGKKEGTSIHNKMTGIYPFFSDYLGLDGPEALDSAYYFISGFSERCVDRLLNKDWNGKNNV